MKKHAAKKHEAKKMGSKAGMDKSKKEYGSMDKKPLSHVTKRGRGKDKL